MTGVRCFSSSETVSLPTLLGSILKSPPVRRMSIAAVVKIIDVFHLREIRQEFRPMLQLAAPMALTELGWISMGFVDTVMVGRLPDSATAIGAVSLGTTLFY